MRSPLPVVEGLLYQFFTQRLFDRLKESGPEAHIRAAISSAGARTLRVLAELLEPRYCLEQHGVEDTIVFFGSARAPGPPPSGVRTETSALGAAYDAARELARRLTLWGQHRSRRFLVASGAGLGIMEAVNRGAADAGGESIGFGIDLPGEQPNQWVTPDLGFLFHYFFTRKFWFVYPAKALVFFPGGFGTLDELFEVLTLVQTGRMQKQVGIVLFGGAFWHDAVNFDALVAHGVIAPEDLALFRVTDSVDEAEAWLRSFLEEHYGPTLLDGLPFEV